MSPLSVLSPLKTKLNHEGLEAFEINDTAPGVISNSIGVILVLSQIVWFLAPEEDLWDPPTSGVIVIVPLTVEAPLQDEPSVVNL